MLIVDALEPQKSATTFMIVSFLLCFLPLTQGLIPTPQEAEHSPGLGFLNMAHLSH